MVFYIMRYDDTVRDYALAILKDSWLSHAETVDMISDIYYIQAILIGVTLLLNLYCLGVLVFNKEMHSFDYYFVFVQTISEIFGCIGLIGIATSILMSIERTNDACQMRAWDSHQNATEETDERENARDELENAKVERKTNNTNDRRKNERENERRGDGKHRKEQDARKT
ncbi:uncharacterized protein LOC142356539, partial [Convolutriloba macropyga]|uniref:uncharacterized protein LOC142356539 n=1 Tax=Convolutriloba macropyga TaxID=536237 RepID=UPI003F51F69B